MILIGENINATRRKIRAMIQERDAQGLSELAKRQEDTGVDYIDVNVGTGVGSREEEVLSVTWAIKTIQQTVYTPLCIDSSDPAVLEAGLKARNGRPSLINSAKAEKTSLEQSVSLSKDYNSPLVALAMDEAGIAKSMAGRLRACEKIAAACEKNGVPLSSVFFDPLVFPISTDVRQGLVTLKTLAGIKERFPMAKTIIGLSNVSYGLPARGRLNAAFLHMAVSVGLDAAILDPLDEELMWAVRTAEVLVGKDRHCRRYTRAFRKS